MRAFRLLSVLALSIPTLPLAAQQQTPRYKNARLPMEQRVQDLLQRMTLPEKFWQLFMSPGNLDDPSHDYSNGAFGLQIGPGSGSGNAARQHADRINQIQRYFLERTRLGVPIIPFEEALHGLAREGATVFPQAIGLAATWDTALAGRVAAAVARETRSRGIRQVLSPVVNIANDVRWGRVEETYGEDPYLASLMGSVFVREFERAGVITTPKHFVANVGEGGRDSYPIDLSLRQLEEYFFPPFRATLESGARSVMTAYNSVDGLPATQNPWLLGDVLKRQWGFQGFVISDAAATGGATVLHYTEPDTPTAARQALLAGLDVVFQSTYEQHRPYWEAFRAGLIPLPVIDSAVARVLRAKFSLGLFEQAFVNPDSAAQMNGNPAHRRLAREAARASLVLLKNESGALPLGRAVGSIAVIGADAIEARLGGYSGPGIAPVSILDGVRARLGNSGRVLFAPGPGRSGESPTVVPTRHLTADSSGQVRPGLLAEYFDNNRLEGVPRLVRQDTTIDFRWTFNPPGPGIPTDWYSVRWTGRITAPQEGVRRLGVEGNDGYRLWLDGRLLIDNWQKVSYRTSLADVALVPGRSYDLKLEYSESTGNARVRLVWDTGDSTGWSNRIDSAVAIARSAEVSLVVAGIEEGEFRDRAYLTLPGHQEDLIRAVAATGKPVVVVLIGGSAITMSAWLDQVDAVLQAWYPGEEGGPAIAEVLFGDASPAGRLPVTFPIAEGQLPLTYNHKPTGRGDDYVDLTGHPLFPFGHGLSYTRFEYTDLQISPDRITAGGSITIRCRVLNVGGVAGEEVVQLYLRDLLASMARPVMQLAGFRRIQLQPGQEVEVTFTVRPEQLRFLNREMKWVVEPGDFRVLVGASSRDIRLRGTFTVRPS